ncbi:MAG: amidase family protein, partial [Pseudomonadota bacterium]
IETSTQATTAGSLALAENFTNKDAPLIAQLKARGAVIVGKTNLSEWANFRSEKSISGWSGVGGQTKNPHDFARSPCGSSSGSAVAVAKGYVLAAIGTETHGSIICPASINGIVGIKPTHGLVSGEGIVPLASSQDTAGPFALTVQNAALTLAAMINPEVAESEAVIEGLLALSSQALALKGQRIGVITSNMGYDSRRDAMIHQHIDLLEAQGAIIVNDLSVDAPDGYWDENYQLLQYEFKRDLNAYLAALPNGMNELTLGKLIAFNEEHADQELVYFDQGIFELSENLELSEDAYLSILKTGRKIAREGLDDLFDQHNLDALIGISSGPAWMIDNVNGDAWFGPGGVSGYPAVGGHPHISIPRGQVGHLPIGLSVIGRRFEDHKIAAIAQSIMALPRLQ